MYNRYYNNYLKAKIKFFLINISLIILFLGFLTQSIYIFIVDLPIAKDIYKKHYETYHNVCNPKTYNLDENNIDQECLVNNNITLPDYYACSANNICWNNNNNIYYELCGNEKSEECQHYEDYYNYLDQTGQKISFRCDNNNYKNSIYICIHNYHYYFSLVFWASFEIICCFSLFTIFLGSGGSIFITYSNIKRDFYYNIGHHILS